MRLVVADASLMLGSATTVASNPFWVIQTTQTSSHTLRTGSSTDGRSKRLGFVETVQRILRKDGAGAFWRGLGPALVLVINPVLQYTFFEQLKNALIRRRTAQLRAAKASSGLGAAAAVVAVLSDMDYFFLGALAKLGTDKVFFFFFFLFTPPFPTRTF